MELESLVVPAANAAEEAGKLILNIKALWAEASLEERRKLLLSMLDAVYFDSKHTKALIAVRPKPPFKPIFQVAATREGSGIHIVNEPYLGSSVFQVEAGEGRLFAVCNPHLLSDLLVVLACNAPSTNSVVGTTFGGRSKRRAGGQGQAGNGRSEKDLAQARRKVEQCKQREERLMSLFEYGGVSKEELVGRLDKVKLEGQEAKKRLGEMVANTPPKVDLVSAESQVKTFCRNISKALRRCTFANKRMALDALRVQVVATQDRVSVKMAVPLEFTTVEKKREYVLPETRRKRRKVALPA